jgi:hypothetical protein
VEAKSGLLPTQGLVTSLGIKEASGSNPGDPGFRPSPLKLRRANFSKAVEAFAKAVSLNPGYTYSAGCGEINEKPPPRTCREWCRSIPTPRIAR